jgi:hypothetical protein
MNKPSASGYCPNRSLELLIVLVSMIAVESY